MGKPGCSGLDRIAVVDEGVDPQISQIFTESIDFGIEIICGNLRNLWTKLFCEMFSCLSFLSWFLSFLSNERRGTTKTTKDTKSSWLRPKAGLVFSVFHPWLLYKSSLFSCAHRDLAVVRQNFEAPARV
jgi:hypothetical protein